jgi:hypothetical protein
VHYEWVKGHADDINRDPTKHERMNIVADELCDVIFLILPHYFSTVMYLDVDFKEKIQDESRLPSLEMWHQPSRNRMPAMQRALIRAFQGSHQGVSPAFFFRHAIDKVCRRHSIRRVED